MIRHRAPISGVVAHGRLIATAGYDNRVILWDAPSGRSLARGCHDHLANQCAFSADGEWLVSSSSDYSARLWSVPEMRLTALLAGHEDDVEGVAFHPSGSLVATASRDHSIGVFDFGGNMLLRLHGHRADVLSIGWLDGGRALVSSSDDGTIRRWDAASGALIETLDFGGVETDTIALAADGTIFAGNDRGEIVIVREGQRRIVRAHDAGIKKIVHDDGSGRVVTLSYDRQARFWQHDSGTLAALGSEPLPPVVWPRACAFAGENSVVFATFGSRYAIFDLARRHWSLEGVERTEGVNGACFFEGRLHTIGDAGVVCAEGAATADVGSLCNFILDFHGHLLCGGQLGRLMNALTGETLHQHRSPLNCAIALMDGAIPALLIGTYTGEALLFHLRGGVPAFVRAIPLHDNAVKGLAANDRALFSVCASGAAAIHRIGDWMPLREDRTVHSRIANGCVALAGGRFASISRDRRLRIWSDTMVEVFETPHPNSIKCCAVSADGMAIATGDYAGRVGVFDVAKRRYAAFGRLSASGISAVIAAPWGGFVATSYDGHAYETGIGRDAG